MSLNLFRIQKGLNIDDSIHIIQNAGVPNAQTDTVAALVGSLYIDTTNKNLYQKISVASGDSTDWKRIVNETIIGVSTDNLGTFTGSTITDSVSIKTALQELETSLETKAASSVVTEIDGNVNDLITLSGVAENATTLGTFTGSTITDNTTVKVALQELETAIGGASGEDAFQNSFMGKTGTGAETPTYSSVVYVTQSGTLEAAIGELDAQMSTNATNIGTNDTDISNLQTALGASTEATIAYTNNNYITDGVDLVNSLSALDGQVATNATNIGTNSTNIGTNDTDISNLQTALGASTEGAITYSSTNYVTNATDTITSIGALDTQIFANTSAISTIETGLDWKSSVNALSADATLNAAVNGTTLSTLLPLSDDEGTALVIGDFAAGDFILSKNGVSSELFYVYDDAGTLKIEDSAGANHAGVAMTALATGHTFYVKNDLADSPGPQENSSAWSYNGSDLVKIADVDWSAADGIDIASGYTAGAGTVTTSDSIQTAIQKLDGNIQGNDTDISNLQGALGASTEAGITYSSTNYVTNATDAVTAIGALDTQVSTNATNIGTNSTNIGANDTDISNLQGALGSSTEAAITYSSTNYVTNATDPITAIGALDIQVSTNATNIGTGATDITNLEAAVGSSTGTAGLAYTSDYFVTDGVSHEANIDALDIALNDVQFKQNFAAVTTATVVASFPHASKAADFKVVVSDGSGAYSAIISALTDGTNIDETVFGELVNGTQPSFSYTLAINGANLELSITAGTAVAVRAYRIYS